MTLNNKRSAFVIGDPIIQSKSPRIHNYWLKQFNLEGSYQAHHIVPEALDEFFETVRRGQFIGGNITAPHKEQAFTFVDSMTPTAKMIGAINTLYFETIDGKKSLIGDNTDAYGFSSNLDHYGPKWREGKNALVIGAGGAARAVLYALKEAKYQKVTVLNRTLTRAEELAAHFGNDIFQAGELTDVEQASTEADIIINTSSAQMSAAREAKTDNFENTKAEVIVTDIVYSPLITPFLASAHSSNRTIIDGFGMLLHQAVPGFEKWFGVRPEVTPALRKFVLDTK